VFRPRPYLSARVFLMFTTVWLLAAAFLNAGQLPVAKPADVGLSAERLERLTRAMQEYVDQGRVAGVVALIARKGTLPYLKAFGKLDLGRGTPMPTNAIFRIASQTKAVTSVAVLMLQEEGKLLIDDPVAKYIPEFAGARVAVQAADKEAKGFTTVPVKRPITIRDLLTHTAGISYGSGPAREPMPIGEVIKKLATLPFDAQPGEKFVYGYNTDILGYLVERVSGMSLADFFTNRITAPLGMTDTHFFLPESKLERFTTVYGVEEKGGLRLVEDARDSFYVKGPRMCYAGGAGLLSTAEDYAQFLQMLLNGGELQGVRLLSPKTVELMTVNHVGRLYGAEGFGLGFAITETLGSNGDPGSVGIFRWGGAYHTTYWIDPAEQMVCVLMTQLLPATNSDLQKKFRALVYQAIVESYEKR
jgi:CubicO group peptidase (beta-lactamase class C family)